MRIQNTKCIWVFAQTLPHRCCPHVDLCYVLINVSTVHALNELYYGITYWNFRADQFDNSILTSLIYSNLIWMDAVNETNKRTFDAKAPKGAGYKFGEIPRWMIQDYSKQRWYGSPDNFPDSWRQKIVVILTMAFMSKKGNLNKSYPFPQAYQSYLGMSLTSSFCWHSGSHRRRMSEYMWPQVSKTTINIHFIHWSKSNPFRVFALVLYLFPLKKTV